MSGTPIFRTRLWSQECAIAEAAGGEPAQDKREPGYEFSHGKRYFTPLPNPYVNFPPIPPEPEGD